MTNSLEELIQLSTRRRRDDLEGKERKKSSHTEDEWWVKKAANHSKEKDDALKEETEEKELATRVAKMGSTHLPPLCPFMAQQTSPTQRDWIVDSGASAHTCCERNQFDLYRMLWPPHLISLGNGKTVPAIGMGDIRLLLRWTQTVCPSHALKGTTFKRFLACGPAELWMVKRQSESKDSPYVPLTGERAVHFRTADTGNGTLNPLQAHLNVKGISHKAANEHAPRIKSAAAQTAHTLLETTQTMLMDADWISRHWGDDLQYATYTLNRAPMPLIAGDPTLRKMFTKKQPVSQSNGSKHSSAEHQGMYLTSNVLETSPECQAEGLQQQAQTALAKRSHCN
ncbi:hypothetical protein SCLCIDRAFT_33590 [Scleroderma citrinum Foug A]|uniref:Retrovirus-related Pol polyprotein from transposon TNT 1-94-like beta-barrel domain-containing protein n=1 Tax=Scleroderma citrinum Foug A TaxID=1036808 RepID=A0A0C3CRN8_9AGAM|nr:hypothetical protein SCLCIDRAFT_33590 [Scleroderma citrinum Foug A]